MLGQDYAIGSFAVIILKILVFVVVLGILLALLPVLTYPDVISTAFVWLFGIMYQFDFIISVALLTQFVYIVFLFEVSVIMFKVGLWLYNRMH